MFMGKVVFWSLVTIFSALGSWIPSLWHAGFFSIAGIIGGVVGLGVGIWLAYLIDNYINV